MAQTLEKIVNGFDKDGHLHYQFWTELISLPYLLDADMQQRDQYCNRITKTYEDSVNAKNKFPSMKDYGDVPYLYVASALLMHFVQNDDLALDILVKNKGDANPDHLYWKLLSRFAYFQGQRTDHVVEPLNRWHREIAEHFRNIEQYCTTKNGCSAEDLRKLKDHEAEEELILMNNYSYFVAEDLARGVKGATEFSSTVDDYSGRIKKAIDSGNHVAIRKWGTDDFLDTYAYAKLVLEAKKSAPDAKIFRQMSHILDQVVESLVNITPSQTEPYKTQFDFASLRAARTHYQAARDLSGE